MHEFNIIVALSKKNNGIGFKNNLPWNLKNELSHFKNLTTNSITNGDNYLLGVVIMGRNTWNSLPKSVKPLPNRVNIVISNTSEELNNYNN